jgi:hypothetical protein
MSEAQLRKESSEGDAQLREESSEGRHPIERMGRSKGRRPIE